MGHWRLEEHLGPRNQDSINFEILVLHKEVAYDFAAIAELEAVHLVEEADPIQRHICSGLQRIFSL